MSSTRTLRWLLAAPALLLGAFVYWTLALGLGAVSLSGMQSLERLDWQLITGGAPMPSPDRAGAAESGEEPAPTADEGESEEAPVGETISVEVVGSTGREYTPGSPFF